MKPLTRLVGAVIALVLLAPLAAGAADRRSVDCSAVRARVQPEIDAACPCDQATNHASYVRCVSAKLRSFGACKSTDEGPVDCGPVPRACIPTLRRMATRSTCGDTRAVTCCVPRQHDCSRDPSPGDGKAEGTCSDSTRPCDRVTDCLIPRCQVAASPERCVLAGGKLGTTKDCTTACE
jgi:hypothetical protein